jgi:putative membrane protein
MLDVLLAVLHHLGVFALFGVLAAEVVLARRGVGAAQVLALANTDRFYGLLSLLVIAVGATRAVFAAKGWDYYAHNGFFWAKMAAFAGVGLLSIRPSLAYVRWRRADGVPTEEEVRKVRWYLNAQLALFALIPVFAVLMARGYGTFG